MDSAIVEINALNAELSRIAQRVKVLKEQRRKAEDRLVRGMKAHGIEEYKSFQLSKLDPTMRPVRKKAAEKKRAALVMFSNEGVDDPESMWRKLQVAMKPTYQ